MKLTFRPVPPARVDFAPNDERFTGFMLHLSSDRRGVSEKEWPLMKGMGKNFSLNGLAYANSIIEKMIVGWSGFRLDMLPALEVPPELFEADDEAAEGEVLLIDFDQDARLWLITHSPLFDKLASKAVKLHNGDDEEDEEDEEQEEEHRKKD